MTVVEKLETWFRAQIGIKEAGENKVKFNTDYYGSPVQGSQYPWCCAFIWDGFFQTGLSSKFCDGAKTAYCPYVMEWAKAHNKFFKGNYKRGDLLLYDWNGDGVADHIGFCTYWSGEYAYAIEGNVDDQVAEVTRWPMNILGAYRPDYGDEEIPENDPDKGEGDAPTALPVLSKGDYGGAVLSAQILLIDKWGFSCGPDGADGDLGPNTEAAIKSFQSHYGLTPVDGVVGPVTWKKLIN